ncbi:MAG: hypothetical protein V4640_06305 [Verrucomicrobiota bacterium]
MRGLVAIAIAGAMAGAESVTAQRADSDSGMEVLTRGPVHEAFAETVVFDPTPGIIIDRQPPELIEELMPDQRPVGSNVEWIPGYWGWDEDQNDFLWISGIWRNLPPGRQWIPGYWAAQDQSYQWTSGYWQDATTSEVSYLPEPPRSVEAGPNVVAVSSNQTWIPGNWLYQENRYAWRAGYWVDARPDWSWTPSYYRWTRRGYIYVDGYWDYPVRNRGVIFAPVRFGRSYISQASFSYSPVTVITLSVFTNHLFLRPSYGHYYFGDYYEPRYRDNYYASYSYNSGRRGYDPIFSHHRWEHRNDQNWMEDRRNYFEYRRDHADARPPRTWAALDRRSMQDRQLGDYGVAERYDQMVRNDGGGRQRFQAVNTRERERFVSQKREIRAFSRERQQQEIAGVSPRGGRSAQAEPNRVKVRNSPLRSTQSDLSEKNGGPPARLKERAPDKKGELTQKPGQMTQGTKAQSKRSEGRAEKANQADLPNRRTDATNQGKATAETRTKPGQRREAEPNSKGKSNQPSQSTPARDKVGNPQNKASKGNVDDRRKTSAADRSGEKVTPKRQASPTPKRQAEPSPKRQAAPTPKRQAEPAPKRQAAPTPKRQASPTPKRQAEPSPKRQASPTPKRQAQPTPKRQAAPTPQRQAEPSPKRQASPTPKRQAQPTPKRQAAPTPQRKADPVRQRKAKSGEDEAADEKSGRVKK